MDPERPAVRDVRFYAVVDSVERTEVKYMVFGGPRYEILVTASRGGNSVTFRLSQDEELPRPGQEIEVTVKVVDGQA